MIPLFRLASNGQVLEPCANDPKAHVANCFPGEAMLQFSQDLEFKKLASNRCLKFEEST